MIGHTNKQKDKQRLLILIKEINNICLADRIDQWHVSISLFDHMQPFVAFA